MVAHLEKPRFFDLLCIVFCLIRDTVHFFGIVIVRLHQNPWFHTTAIWFHHVWYVRFLLMRHGVVSLAHQAQRHCAQRRYGCWVVSDWRHFVGGARIHWQPQPLGVDIAVLLDRRWAWCASTLWSNRRDWPVWQSGRHCGSFERLFNDADCLCHGCLAELC